MDGGIPQLMKLLAQPEERAAIGEVATREMAQQWSDVFIASVGSERNQPLVGRGFEDLAEARGASGIDIALDLLVEENGAVNILSFNQSEENLRELPTHPLCTVISDGFYVKGRPHPRLYGTFPCLLGEIARQRGWLTLAEAVHKITGKPTARFGLKSRGRLAAGHVADVAVFDPERIAARATYENPQTPPDGVAMVFRGGRRI